MENPTPSFFTPSYSPYFPAVESGEDGESDSSTVDDFFFLSSFLEKFLQEALTLSKNRALYTKKARNPFSVFLCFFPFRLFPPFFFFSNSFTPFWSFFRPFFKSAKDRN